jgi:hypothetical protein
LPDLELIARTYISKLEQGEKTASIDFVRDTIMGVEKRPRGLRGIAETVFGNAHHLWMWDHYSLTEELKKAGFRDIRNCKFNDSTDPMFRLVEEESRFLNAVALEARK